MMIQFEECNNLKRQGIYLIANIKSGKFYVGSSKNLYIRQKNHIKTLKKNTHHNILLQRAWNKYGEDKFRWYILEFIDREENLAEWEEFYMKVFASHNRKISYNLCTIARGRKVISEEYRKKLSDHSSLRLQSKEYRRNMNFKRWGSNLEIRPLVAKDYEKKVRSVDIMKKYNISQDIMYGILREYGVKLRSAKIDSINQIDK